jgi:hypothetical protein
MKENGNLGIQAIIRGMFLPQFSLISRIDNLAKLLLAEEILDDMAGTYDLNEEYWMLHARAVEYVRANRELLVQPWLRNGGAVYDIIAKVRNEVYGTPLLSMIPKSSATTTRTTIG